jgi:hypothetical protein
MTWICLEKKVFINSSITFKNLSLNGSLDTRIIKRREQYGSSGFIAYRSLMKVEIKKINVL